MRRVETMPVSAFAQLLGKTRQRVDQYIQDGMPYRNAASGREIYPAEAIQWLIDRAEANGKKGAGSDEEKERVRRMRAEADLKEAEARERLGKSVPAEEWQAFLDRFISNFAANVRGRLQRFERDIVRCSAAPEARQLTQKIQISLFEGSQEYADELEREAAELETQSQAQRAEGA